MIRKGNLTSSTFRADGKDPFITMWLHSYGQAKARFPQHLREELIHDYLDALHAYCPMPESYFREQLRQFVLFRTLQVLGAYGFRGYFEQKPHFLQSIPYAIENLDQLLEEDFPAYPYLCKVLKQLTRASRICHRTEQAQAYGAGHELFPIRKGFRKTRPETEADMYSIAVPSIIRAIRCLQATDRTR